MMQSKARMFTYAKKSFLKTGELFELSGFEIQMAAKSIILQ